MTAVRLYTLSFPANPNRLKALRAVVEQAAVLAGCDEAGAAQVVIAVNEACMNVIQHAYKGDDSNEVVVLLSAEEGVFTCRIEDSAPPADLHAIRPRALDDVRPGGLGTHFITELMDECNYGHRTDERGNFLEMTRKIP
ncbi:MAG: anti-sigma regulatory factor (Ser/Thr protein kinase) [Gammaproteobacteria bacterium]|jgi:anti-sigma regulatory factor (Ser/Thr protein kinase)